MTDTHYSSAIVGAGPAGATCANALLLGGATSVVLIDRARFPRDKACGDGIGPGVLTILDQLNLRDTLSAHHRVTQMSMTSPLGSRMSLDTNLLHRRSPLGYVIPRLTFDHALLAAALNRGSADMTGWTLETAAFADRGWQLTLSSSETGETRTIKADVLIGADGARSKVRRILGQSFSRDEHSSIAVRVYSKAEGAFPARQQLDAVKEVPSPGYGWVFSTGTGVVNVGVGVDLAVYKAKKLHLNQMLAAYRAYLADDLLYDEESCRSAILPLASDMPRLAFPEKRAALIGDAASMINPLTGEGIFYGMHAGLELGKRLAAAAKRPSDLARALVQYERDFRRTFTPHFRGNWYLRKLLEKPVMMERMVASCARNRDLCCDYIEYMMGNESDVRAKPLYRIALDTVFA